MLSLHTIGLRQGGAALLLMLLVMIIFVGTFIVHSSDDAEEIKISQREQTARALAEAKEALLRQAVIDWIGEATGRPGEFICPDLDNDGELEPGEIGAACENIGWLPWKTLELEDLKDASGHRLWYAVSEDFQDDGAGEPDINPGSVGQLIVQDDLGVTTDRAAAVIIAPGSALALQNRSAGDNDVDAVIAQYLEGENTDFDVTFTNTTTAALNDQIMTITVDEIMERVAPLAMGEIAAALRRYYTAEGFYPYSELDATATCDNGTTLSRRNIGFPVINVVSGPGQCPYTNSLNNYALPGWVTTLDWYKYVFSVVAEACVSGTVNCNGGGGLLSLDGIAGIQAMTVYVGRELEDIDCATKVDHDQDRAAGSDDLCSYLETVVNTEGDDDLAYIRPNIADNSNDKFMIVAP